MPADGTRWEEWTPYVQFVMLGLATAVAASTAHLFGVDGVAWLIIQALLVAGAFAWSWWWVIRRSDRSQDHRRVAIHFAGRAVLTLALTWINPFFGIYAWVGFIDLGDLHGRWTRRAGMVAVAVPLAGSQSGGFPLSSGVQWLIFMVLLGINVGLAMLMVHLQRQDSRRSEQQAAMIAELKRVNADLERAAQVNAKLEETVVAQARRAGIQDERQRLAREIHDTIAQSLAATLAQLQASEEEDDPRARVRRATELVRAALGEARRSVMDLTPMPLTAGTLTEAVTTVVQDWAEDQSSRVDVVVTGDARTLHPEVEATVLRITQEALSNIAKHAGARRVGVTLTYDEDQIALDVRDDGVGFDPGAVTTATSFGLRGMQQRAARLAGILDLETGAGSGTAVSLHLPALPPEVAA